MSPNHRYQIRYRFRYYWLRYRLFLNATAGTVLICLASIWLATALPSPLLA